MLLSLFDLDHTLISGDSDVLWTEFLVEKGVLDSEAVQKSDEFYRQYEEGTLRIDEFLSFQLEPLGRYNGAKLESWRREYVAEKIRPVVREKAVNMLSKCRRDDHEVVIITATNRFVTEPIAELFGVETLLATEVEKEKGRLTGRSCGTPCFREGKITRLEEWLASRRDPVEESWFYSDSSNDIPLLEWVSHPFAVDPDKILTRHAAECGWPIISLE